MTIRYTEWISSSPANVFPWIAEPQKAMLWQREVKEAETLLAPPDVVGTTFREIVQEDGRELAMTGVVTGFSPDEEISFHLSSRIHELDVSYTLRSRDAGTQIAIEATVRWKFPMSVVSLFIHNRMAKQLTDQLESETQELKRVCESR